MRVVGCVPRMISWKREKENKTRRKIELAVLTAEIQRHAAKLQYQKKKKKNLKVRGKNRGCHIQNLKCQHCCCHDRCFHFHFFISLFFSFQLESGWCWHRGLCSCPWTGVEPGSALWATSNWSKFAPSQLMGGETWIDSVYQGRLTRAWEPPAGTLTGSKYLQMNRAVWLRWVHSETLALVILPISCCCLMCYSSQDYRPQLASGCVRMIQTRKWKADEGTHLHHYCVQGVCRKHCVFKLLIETKKLEKYLFCKILTSNHKLLPHFKYYIIYIYIIYYYYIYKIWPVFVPHR